MISNYLLWHLFKPSQLLLYLLLFGVLFRGRLWGRVLAGGAVAALVACAALPIATSLARPLEERFPRPVVDDVDGIVVLAGSERAAASVFRGQPQLNGHADRLTTFLMLANRFPQARLVHSGGSADAQLDQSAVAREILLGTGIAAQRVTFENRSGNTCASARRIRSLVDASAEETWLLVTSAVHMPRAMACFRAAGWDVVPYPADYQTGASLWWFGFADNLMLLDLAAHEWVGLAYYRLRGVTEELYPAPRP